MRWIRKRLAAGMKARQPPCAAPPQKLPEETSPVSFNLNFMPKKEITKYSWVSLL